MTVLWVADSGLFQMDYSTIISNTFSIASQRIIFLHSNDIKIATGYTYLYKNNSFRKIPKKQIDEKAAYKVMYNTCSQISSALQSQDIKEWDEITARDADFRFSQQAHNPEIALIP